MHIKVVPPDSWDFGEKAAQLIKIANSGLRGNDLSSLVKRAGHELATMVKNANFSPGEVPVHLIALGAGEAFGPNKNFDTFSAATCRKYYDTFVKHAKVYRYHKNKDPRKSYGVVKLAHFNEDMKRVELIIALNGTKEAAEKNEGLVADEELEKLANDQYYGVSMSTTVPWDVCTGCGNKAKTRKEYCLGVDEGGMCKYGGLRNNIGLVADDGHIQCADNPIVKWFDISRVGKPADRTAYIMGKVASVNPSHNIGGAELAELMGLTPSVEMLYSDIGCSADTIGTIKVAHELAQRENSQISYNLDKAVNTSCIDGITKFGEQYKPQLLRIFADNKILLNFDDWLRVTTNEAHLDKYAEEIQEVKSCLPTIFNILLEDPDLPSLIKSNPVKSASYSDLQPIIKWANKFVNSHSLESNCLQQRIWRSSFQQTASPRSRIKSASSSVSASSLAKLYAVYQLNFIQDAGLNDLGKNYIVELNRIQ